MYLLVKSLPIASLPEHAWRWDLSKEVASVEGPGCVDAFICAMNPFE